MNVTRLPAVVDESEVADQLAISVRAARQLLRREGAGFKVGRRWKTTPELWTEELTPHAMRHTVASVLADRGASENSIKLWFAERLGKAGYTHRLTHRPDYLADAAAALDGFMREIEIAVKSEKGRVGARPLSTETWRSRDRSVTSPKCRVLETIDFAGAGEGIRTLDPNLGKVKVPR